MTITPTALSAAQILDSRGFPTVEVRMTLDDGAVLVASAPAGASTGEHEAVELRDGGAAFSGRGVTRAVQGVERDIGPLLTGTSWESLATLDAAVRDLDGTGNDSRLGANAVVAVSIAAARAFAHVDGVPLHRWIATTTGATELLPVPHFNVLNGGAHAANELEFQEFMIAPVGARAEEEAVRIGAEVYHALADLVRRRYGAAGLGDEGGFAPPIADPTEALDLLVEAIGAAGHRPALDGVAIALDPAANGFGGRDGIYRFGGRELDRDAMTRYYADLLDAYPIRSLEDGFAEDDLEGWTVQYDALAGRVQLVGDDLYVTDAERIRSGAGRYSNAALIKPNQIGTVTQTFEAIGAARDNGMACMVSHRSGETSDDFIADLVVGTGVGQIKSGAPARGERVAKYNRLMRIDVEQPGLRFGLS